MVDITDSVVQTLQNDAALKKLVGDRIYWVKPPGEKYNFPFLTVIESGNTPVDFEDDEERTDQIDIQVEIFSTGKFKDIKDAIDKSMVSQGYERQSNGPDEYILELKVYHKSLNYTKQVEVI